MVVLPWVPATAMHRRGAAMAARTPPAGRPARPGGAASTTSGLSGRTAGETVTTSAAGRRCAARWPIGHRDALGAPAARCTGDALRSLPVTVWPMAASTVAMALMPAPPMPTTWTGAGPRSPSSDPIGPPAAPGSAGHAASTSSATRAAASGRPSVPGGPGHRREPGRARRAAGRRAPQPAGCRRTRRRGPGPRPRRHRAPGRWPSGGRPGRPAAGPGRDGTPATASSATVIAPARQTTTSAAAYSRSIRSSKGTRPEARPVGAVAGRPGLTRHSPRVAPMTW